jgi:hypothetical protein
MNLKPFLMNFPNKEQLSEFKVGLWNYNVMINILVACLINYSNKSY